MPIRTEHRRRYRTPEWKRESAIVRARAAGKCERCKAPHNAPIWRWREDPAVYICCDDGEVFDGAGENTGRWRVSEWDGVESGPIIVVLTVAHLDHNDWTATADRMQHLCQRCHNILDAPHRVKQAKKTNRAKKSRGQEVLF